MDGKKIQQPRVSLLYPKFDFHMCNYFQDVNSLVAMPQKATHIALVESEKVVVLDVKNKKVVRTIAKWGGMCTQDGKYGLYAPTR